MVPELRVLRLADNRKLTETLGSIPNIEVLKALHQSDTLPSTRHTHFNKATPPNRADWGQLHSNYQSGRVSEEASRNGLFNNVS